MPQQARNQHPEMECGVRSAECRVKIGNFLFFNFDELVKSRKAPVVVIPAKVGIQ